MISGWSLDLEPCHTRSTGSWFNSKVTARSVPVYVALMSLSFFIPSVHLIDQILSSQMHMQCVRQKLVHLSVMVRIIGIIYLMSSPHFHCLKCMCCAVSMQQVWRTSSETRLRYFSSTVIALYMLSAMCGSPFYICSIILCAQLI